jgi:hypothetical protein
MNIGIIENYCQLVKKQVQLAQMELADRASWPLVDTLDMSTGIKGL